MCRGASMYCMEPVSSMKAEWFNWFCIFRRHLGRGDGVPPPDLPRGPPSLGQRHRPSSQQLARGILQLPRDPAHAHHHHTAPHPVDPATDHLPGLGRQRGQHAVPGTHQQHLKAGPPIVIGSCLLASFGTGAGNKLSKPGVAFWVLMLPPFVHSRYIILLANSFKGV